MICYASICCVRYVQNMYKHTSVSALVWLHQLQNLYKYQGLRGRMWRVNFKWPRTLALRLTLIGALCQAHMSGRFWKFDSFCKALLQRRVGGHGTFPTIIFHWMPVIGKVYTETFIDVWMSFRVTCFVASSWSEPNSDMDFLVVNLLLRFSTQP